MHGPISKIPSKKSRQAALRGGFNSGVKGFIRLGQHCLCFIRQQSHVASEEAWCLNIKKSRHTLILGNSSKKGE
jgi:hypothetical protein